MAGDSDMFQKIMGRITARELDVTHSYGKYMFRMDLDRRIKNTELGVRKLD